MSFMDSYNEAMGSFQDGLRRTLHGDDPTDEQIIAWVRRRYGQKIGDAVSDALLSPPTPGFADALRRSMVREMTTR